ncbi:PLP-dependent aminotransferase family protein [Nonomuraea sp. B12E4]|uniref:aminotransferase-like domain-containing protein n=1 Tax=Nonomuraea sp. B12E4 TaxID=3153564 RepID=UPI00325C8CA7
MLKLHELHSSVSDPALDTMNFLNEVAWRYPEAISFAAGRPYGEFFDSELVFTYLRAYLDDLATRGRSWREVRDHVYQYGPTAGHIRQVIADWLRQEEDIDVPPESIVVTAGAQEAMLLTLRALIRDRDDVLLAATPCYVGIIGAARLLEAPLTPVEEREGRLVMDDLVATIAAERSRGRRPRLLYLVPDHANPSGGTMPIEDRRALLDLAAEHDFLIMEDSPYRLVSEGRQVPTLKSLDRGRRVVHLGSFSKTVFPGARVGFAVADQPVATGTGTGLLAEHLTKIKSMVTVNTSSLGQAAVAGAIMTAGGLLSKLNAQGAAHYGGTMRSVLEHLDRWLPADRRAALGVSWNAPRGGFFLSMTVPFRTDEAALVRSAQEFGVIWTPMSYFYPDGGGERAIRLSTSYLTPEEITEGTARLARFIEAEGRDAR